MATTIQTAETNGIRIALEHFEETAIEPATFAVSLYFIRPRRHIDRGALESEAFATESEARAYANRLWREIRDNPFR